MTPIRRRWFWWSGLALLSVVLVEVGNATNHYPSIWVELGLPVWANHVVAAVILMGILIAIIRKDRTIRDKEKYDGV